jgi:hypothetical protein
MLFCVPLYRYRRRLIVKQPIAFYHMQRLGERRAEPVDHGKWADFHAGGVDHQRIAFIMADGIAIPASRHG